MLPLNVTQRTEASLASFSRTGRQETEEGRGGKRQEIQELLAKEAYSAFCVCKRVMKGRLN